MARCPATSCTYSQCSSVSWDAGPAVRSRSTWRLMCWRDSISPTWAHWWVNNFMRGPHREYSCLPISHGAPLDQHRTPFCMGNGGSMVQRGWGGGLGGNKPVCGSRAHLVHVARVVQVEVVGPVVPNTVINTGFVGWAHLHLASISPSSTFPANLGIHTLLPFPPPPPSSARLVTVPLHVPRRHANSN